MTATTPREALESLRTHQEQLDQDGIMVGVSRQALDEVIAYCASLEANQRTAGTVEVCKLCRLTPQHTCTGHKFTPISEVEPCPIKQVTNEKA